MEATSAFALSRKTPSAQKFFQNRETLIAQEKKHRSGENNYNRLNQPLETDEM
jgi:hypothetical protein